MWFIKVQRWTNGYDAMRIDRVMTFQIVSFGMFEIACFGNAGPLIKVARIGPQVRVVHQAFQVAFEVTVIHKVKAQQRR